MDIATIQKRKFLHNIYKLLYSAGSKPAESEVRQAFGKYFSVNQAGQPLNIDYNALNIQNTTNVDLLNELMANSIFNLEVLYDAVFENNQQAFSVVTAFNNKLETLRMRRKELEAKVDQLLFSNSNTDGYFYSFMDTFSSLSNIDMNLTTALVDLVNNNVTLPKITNISSDSIAARSIVAGNATMSSTVDGQAITAEPVVFNIDQVFDGLNDTYWNYDIKSAHPGVASVTLNIPINVSYSISKIDGSILTSSPCTVVLRATSTTTGREEQVRVKEPLGDYTRFSFSIPADYYSSISLTLIKVEPDRVDAGVSGSYIYSFGLRELSISSSYYDQRAVVVSSPIKIPSNDNSNLAISAIALEAQSQISPGTAISYYVAADVPNASEVAAFNWLRIDPSDVGQTQNIVRLTSSNIKTAYIDSINSDLILIPDNTASLNANELNPVALPLSEKVVYRVAPVDPAQKIIEPFILAGLNSFKYYNIILATTKIEAQVYKSLSTWSQYINASESVDLNVDVITSQVNAITPSIHSANVGLLETKLLCDTERVVTHSLTKSREDFNLAVYLNGILIADLPSGTLTKTVEWNFSKGINLITVTYDKSFSGLMSFNLMTGKNLNEYGTVFLDYFSYLDPIQYRRSNTDSVNVFTIDNLFGRREILSSKKIANRSIIKYYTNVADLVTAIRYRADLVRFDNPLQTPIVDAVRLKFKHNDASV